METINLKNSFVTLQRPIPNWTGIFNKKSIPIKKAYGAKE